MLSVDLKRKPPWGKGNAKKIIDLLGGSENILAVGGCVRDWLADLPVNDIDFATKHLPNKTMDLLKNNNFKVLTIGVDHGTVRVIIGRKSYEITSLRKDVMTDGRHAKVKFGKSWYEDANRRDFTVNALYADDQGTVYDPLGSGFKDLQDGKLKFIGDPKKRIKEDYLRILRYFRFLSRFPNDIDKNSLQCCIDEAKKISLLSGERIFSELSKILIDDNAIYVIEKIQKENILKYIFTYKSHNNLFFEEKDLKNIFKHVSFKNNFINKFLIFLSFLIQSKNSNMSEKIISDISERLNFSKMDSKLLLRNARWIENIDKITAKEIKLLWLDHTKKDVDDLKIILKIIDIKKFNILEEIFNNKPPKFPCSGKDAKKLGFKEGKKIGLALKSTREWWLDHECLPGYGECFTKLKEKL